MTTLHDKEIATIQKFIKKYINTLKSLEPVTNTTIHYSDIQSFYVSTRSENDTNNKKRENIIVSIINGNIHNDYYKYSYRWNQLKNQINSYLKKLCEIQNIHMIHSQKCIQKAGRGHHYDFKIIINETIEFNVEFKFNAESIKQIPQFVSPMKPSQYLETSYEEYYYDHYLKEIESDGFTLPNREEYLKQIHSTNPVCVGEIQKKYDNGCKKSSKYSGNKEDVDFYQKMKELSKKSIQSFISCNELKINELTNYLLETQKNKYYMLFKNFNMYLQDVNMDNYIIVDYEKDVKSQRYIATTKTGIKMKILLRWKNGNGVAYPAFQIS